MTPAKQVQLGSNSLCSPRQSQGKKEEKSQGNRPRGSCRRMPSVCKTPKAQKRGQRRGRSGSGPERWAARGCHRRVRWRGCHEAASPLPASGPSHSHAGPAPPRAPPASGTLNCRAWSIGRQLPASGRATRKQLLRQRRGSALSTRPTLPPEAESTKTRSARELSRDLERTGSCSPWRCFLLVGPLQFLPGFLLFVGYHGLHSWTDSFNERLLSLLRARQRVRY